MSKVDKKTFTMRFLLPILCLCIGFAAANLFEEAAPVINEALAAFEEGMSKTGRLRHALNMPDAYELDEVEDDTKKELVAHLKKVMEELLERIKERIDHGKEVAKDLLEQVKKYEEELKEKFGEDIGPRDKELVDKIKEKAKDALRLLEKFGIGKRNLDQEFDIQARSKFSEFIERLKEKMLNNENIRKIREYIRNFATNNPLIKAVKAFLEKLEDGHFKEFIRSLFEHKRQDRGVKEMWEKFKDWLKNDKEHIKEKIKAFQEWLKNTMDEGFEKLKEKYGMIKALALEVIAHAKDIHGEVAREALEFFRPYKEDLGKFWEQLVSTLKEHIGSF